MPKTAQYLVWSYVLESFILPIKVASEYKIHDIVGCAYWKSSANKV